MGDRWVALGEERERERELDVESSVGIPSVTHQRTTRHKQSADSRRRAEK